jgi:hypothetical protein
LQSIGCAVPAHTQFALNTSLIVFALLSLHDVPGKADPFGTPRQSRQLLFGINTRVATSAHATSIDRRRSVHHAVAVDRLCRS